jgi:hypothetical protein
MLTVVSALCIPNEVGGKETPHDSRRRHMIKDIIVNLSVNENGSVVGTYAVSVAAALQAHLTGVAFI